MADSAAREARDSKRQIVVLVCQRPGEVLELLPAGCRRLRAFCSRRLAATATALVGLTRRGAFEVAAAGTTLTLAREHDQLTDVDLGAVPRLAFLVLPLPVFDPPLDVELVPLLYVPLHDVCQLGRLRVPDDAAMPLRLLLA